MKIVLLVCFSLLISYKTINPQNAPSWRIFHRRPSVPMLSLLRSATSHYRRAEPGAAPVTKRRITFNFAQFATNKREYRLGRLNPKEFRVWFVREYLKQGPRIRFTEPPTKPGENLFFTRATTTDTRFSHYYEPYWLDGHWVFSTRVDPESYEYGMNYSYIWNTTQTAEGNWTTWRHCVPVCLTPYKDYGAICAWRLHSGETYWRYEYANFDDMCQINHINCAYYYSMPGWQVLHRGKCPEHYLKDHTYNYYTFDPLWTPETLIAKYGWWMPSKAAIWASMPYSPYRQRVPPLVPGWDFTVNYDAFRRRMNWTWHPGNITGTSKLRSRLLKHARISKLFAKLASVTPSMKALRRTRHSN